MLDEAVYEQSIRDCSRASSGIVFEGLICAQQGFDLLVAAERTEIRRLLQKAARSEQG
jgi:hypothetical protein